VIEINKEFTEFFNDPERERLNWWQSIVKAAGRPWAVPRVEVLTNA
jgi:hypothetical protein